MRMVHPLFYIRSHQLLLGRVSSLMYPKMGLFLIYSDYLFAENTLTSTRLQRDNYKYELQN